MTANALNSPFVAFLASLSTESLTVVTGNVNNSNSALPGVW